MTLASTRRFPRKLKPAYRDFTPCENSTLRTGTSLSVVFDLPPPTLSSGSILEGRKKKKKQKDEKA